jgi:hypothetical protein
MNKNTNSNIKLSNLYGLPILKKIKNKGIIDIYIENKLNINQEIENKNHIINNKNLEIIIKLNDLIINSNNSKSELILSNKNNLDLNNLKILNNQLIKFILNDFKSINEQQYIELISPLNSKLLSITNHMYTFTNRPYKQINKNLYNLYLICKSAFLNMSSIISKPIVSINPNLIKITLFYY